jgi:DNA-binding ferritin-like protein (Dps family)
MRIQEILVRIQDAIEGKKKWQEKWRAHMARVKALPQDYQIVYKEIQNYLFKVGPVELTDGTDFLSGDLLSGIIDLFEEGAALGKGVLEVTGRDVAAFCDDLIKDSKTFADILQESIAQEVNKDMKKATDKTK